ncbi:MAG: mevalonate kinase [Thermoproteales archaeon]|nr:mevalonate kinase [Thermoproteales archaeon]
MRVTASAPGKVILVGEHFVVENEPAVALAINLRALVTVEDNEGSDVFYSKNLGAFVEVKEGRVLKGAGDGFEVLRPLVKIADILRQYSSVKKPFKLTVNSSIPPASGMGSSAAVSVAACAALSRFFNLDIGLDDISKIAYEAEKIVHGKPSGIDNTISTYAGAIIYRKSEGFIRLDIQIDSAAVIIADSGIPRRTGEMVKQVRDLKKRYPEVLDPLYHAAGHLSIEAARALEEGDLWKLGELMNINHGLLSAIGVSNMKLEELVYTARRAGALGAKITGAGGGGCIIAIAYKKKADDIARALKKVASRVYVLEATRKGVSIDEVVS